MSNQKWIPVKGDGIRRDGKVEIKYESSGESEISALNWEIVNGVIGIRHDNGYFEVAPNEQPFRYRYITEPEHTLEHRVTQSEQDILSLSTVMKEHCRDFKHFKKDKPGELPKVDTLTLDQCEVGILIMNISTFQIFEIVAVAVKSIQLWNCDTERKRWVPECDLDYYEIHSPKPKPKEQPLTLADCRKGMQLECKSRKNYIRRITKICDSDALHGVETEGNGWIGTHCLKDYRIHTPEPVLKPRDCVKRKIKILSTDFQGKMKNYDPENIKPGDVMQCLEVEGDEIIVHSDVKFNNWFFSTKDLECCEIVPEDEVDFIAESHKSDDEDAKNAVDAEHRRRILLIQMHKIAEEFGYTTILLSEVEKPYVKVTDPEQYVLRWAKSKGLRLENDDPDMILVSREEWDNRELEKKELREKADELLELVAAVHN